MKKILFVLFFTVIAQSIFAQKVDIIVLDEFEPNSSLTIVSRGNDPLMIRDYIENEFMFSDIEMKIISPTLAQETIKLSNDINVDLDVNSKIGGNINQTIEVQTKPTIKITTVYSLTFKYTYNAVTGGLKDFSGQIIDMKDGSIVVKFRREGKAFGYGTSKSKIIKKIVQNISKLSK